MSSTIEGDIFTGSGDLEVDVFGGTIIQPMLIHMKALGWGLLFCAQFLLCKGQVQGYSQFPRKGRHSMPCRATGGGSGAGREAETGGRGEPGPHSCIEFHGKGLVG